MKVVQINCSFRGSPGTMMRILSDKMTSVGIDNRMFCTFGSTESEFVITYSSKAEVKLNALKSRVSGRYGFVSNRTTQRLIGFLESYQPDLVHMHVIHGHDFNTLMLFQWLGEHHIPVIHTYHDCWMFTGYCPNYAAAGCDNWKKTCHTCPLRSDYSWFFDKCTQNQKDKKKAVESISNYTIVVPSHWMQSQIAQSVLKESRCVVIPNGINTDVFKPCGSEKKLDLGIPDKKMVLTIALSLTKAKGSDDLIELSRILPKDYQLVLVGVSDDMKRKLPDNILAFPRTSSQEELAAYYSAADVLVNPTYQDNFPTVNLEALSCGTPVVTYRTGGSPETIDQKTGIVVDSKNVKDLCSAVQQAAENSSALAEDCRKRAVSKFDRSIFEQNYMNLYRSVLSD